MREFDVEVMTLSESGGLDSGMYHSALSALSPLLEAVYQKDNARSGFKYQAEMTGRVAQLRAGERALAYLRPVTFVTTR
jgi:hypothetical protein